MHLSKLLPLCLLCILAFSEARRFGTPRRQFKLTQNASRLFGGEPVYDINFHTGSTIVMQNGERTGCPGVVIHPRYVVTAAHCFMDEDEKPTVNIQESRIYAPVHYKRNFQNPRPKIQYKFKALYIHKDWDFLVNGNAHDIAIVHLNKRIPKRLYQKVHLPKKRSDFPKADEILYLVQFQHDDNPDRPSDPLHRAEMVHKTRRQMRVELDYFMGPEEICTVSPGFPNEATTGSCGGDSGSGIFRMLDDGSYMHVGVTASGDPCEEPDSLHFFTSTAYYYDDIVNLIRRRDDSGWTKVE